MPGLQADLVVMDEEAGSEPRRHSAASGGLGCFGRRRYSVFGTSTLGGFRGIGFLTLACTGFFLFTRSVYAF
jgi:hypothetical protein